MSKEQLRETTLDAVPSYGGWPARVWRYGDELLIQSGAQDVRGVRAVVIARLDRADPRVRVFESHSD